MDEKTLTEIFEGKTNGAPIDEVLRLSKLIDSSVNTEFLRNLHTDLATFFSGSHPSFQKNTMPYHNFRHSMMVVLATARLFHGLHCHSVNFSTQTLTKGLIAAYFHDTGMLLQENDPASSGTTYIANHETRSIQFMEEYLERKNFDSVTMQDCAMIINYTDLAQDPAEFKDHDREIQMAGQVVGSADILAQMADRYYLECLPLLFDEQEAGGVNKHHSALELMEHTANFYHNVVLKRLITTLSNTSQMMRIHFRESYAIDRNLYLDNIDKNINYLKEIIQKCGSITCVEGYLKRHPPEM